MTRHRDYKALTVNQAGRKGGLARACRITPCRKKEIAEASRDGHAMKRAWGISRRELCRRITERVREHDPDLSYYVAWTLRAPVHIAVGLVDLLSESAFLVLERAVYSVLAELVMGNE